MCLYLHLLQKLQHPLYEVHWVWGGSTLEAKRQNMRDAIRFHDPPEYYTTPQLLSFDLDFLEVCVAHKRAAQPRAAYCCWVDDGCLPLLGR